MALETPSSAAEVATRAINDVALALAQFGAKPALKNSWLNSLIVAYSNRVFDLYFALQQAELEAIPDTAVENLERWAAIWGITRTAGVRSTGNAVASGTLASVIPIDTVLTVADGKKYETLAEATITASSGVAITSILRSGQVATVTTPVDHGLTDNIAVTISGATETEYNVTDAAITVTGADTFTYVVIGSPTSPEPTPGGVALAYERAVLSVRSIDFGTAQDQLFDTVMTFESPIIGVDNDARVDFDALGGGANQETDAALRERLLDRIQNPVAQFNVAQIVAEAKTVAGVTRVFVEEITPAVGEVTIYFMRDNDADPIPSGGEVAAVDAVIQAIRPATSAPGDVIVAAPSPQPEDFTFSALSPNTAGMRAAVEANLEQFFAERTEVGVDVDEDAYRAAIFSSVDTTTGDVVLSFTLSTPSGDLTIAAGEIGTLGNVTFP